MGYRGEGRSRSGKTGEGNVSAINSDARKEEEGVGSREWGVGSQGFAYDIWHMAFVSDFAKALE